MPEPQLPQPQAPPEAALVGAAAFAGLLLYLLLRGRAGRDPLRRGDAVAVIYDSEQGALRVVPVTRVVEGLYIDEGGSTLLAVPQANHALRLLPWNRPCFLAVAVGGVGATLDPEATAKLGIASLGIRELAAQVPAEDPTKVIEALLEKWEQARGEVVINPRLRLSIAYRVPDIVYAYLHTRLLAASATVHALLESWRAAGQLSRLWLERERARARAREALLRWLVVLALGAGFVLVMLLVLSRPPPGGAP